MASAAGSVWFGCDGFGEFGELDVARPGVVPPARHCSR